MGSNVLPGRPGTRDALDALRRIVQGLRESSRAAERDLGLSGARLFVLRSLAEAPGLSLNELALRTRTHQSSVSAVVSALTRARLITRRTASDDGRRAELWLTPLGQQRLRGSRATAQERLVAGIEALPVSQRERLAVTLSQLAEAMALPARRPAMFFEERRPRRRRAEQPR